MNLQQWLDKYPNKAIAVWSSNQNGCDEGFLEDLEIEDRVPWTDYYYSEYNWSNNEIRVKDKGDSCEFTLNNIDYVLTAVDHPRDKWGNTATYQGCNLLKGCYQVGYWITDDGMSIESDAIFKFLEPETPDLNSENDFINWVLESYPEILDTISHRGKCDSTPWEWGFYTTNKPLDGEDWQKVVLDYLVEVKGG